MKRQLLFLTFAASAAVAAPVEINVGQEGLDTLQFAGRNWLADGRPMLPGATKVEVQQQQVTITCDWGVVRLDYRVSADRLTVAVTLSNQSDRVIRDWGLTPLQLRFPQPPAGWDQPAPRIQQSLDRVVALPAVVGPHQLVACLDTVYPPLAFGFGKPLDAARTVYPLELGSGVPVSDPDLSLIHGRGLWALEPGQSRTVTFSLRFAAADASLADVAADVFAGFRKVYPPLNDWLDRRPIGMLMLHSGGEYKSPGNPRGWFRSRELDVRTDEGRTAFRKLALEYADLAVGSLQAFGAQGGIVWNIEGEENPHPITYIGDPRMLPILAPEMDSVADEFFAKFRAAGLKTGVTIRPTQLYFEKSKNQWDHGTGSHGPERNPLQENFDALWPKGLDWWRFYPVVERMCRKIEYAKKRWGCTIFYIDTNGIFCQTGAKDEFRWMLLTGHMLKRIKERHPDILLIPELTNDDFTRHVTNWAYGAQYQELDLGGHGTPAAVRAVYPEAFSVVNIADGPIEEQRAALVRAVRNGDILMTRGWFGDHRNAIVKSIYEEAGHPAFVRP